MSERRVNFGLWYDFRTPNRARLGLSTCTGNRWIRLPGPKPSASTPFGSPNTTFVKMAYTPSPLVIAAAIGERTKRMCIGTNLMLLPLADPVRLAEDAAAVSILTGGRFDLGVGLGYRSLEFDYFGQANSVIAPA